MTPEQLTALRREYSLQSLRRGQLQEDPIRQFQAWLDEAIMAGALEPNAMALATVDAEGRPWTRTVLLKVCDEHGFVFFTNYKSAKARHIEAAPHVAATFWWPLLQRQVNVTGVVNRTSREESERYFAGRPVKSQLGAWASSQSEVIANRGELETRFNEALVRFQNAPVPTPEAWGGYRIRPESIEFWQGQQSRLHDRLRFSRDGSGWKIERLSP